MLLRLSLSVAEGVLGNLCGETIVCAEGFLRDISAESLNNCQEYGGAYGPTRGNILYGSGIDRQIRSTAETDLTVMTMAETCPGVVGGIEIELVLKDTTVA